MLQGNREQTLFTAGSSHLNRCWCLWLFSRATSPSRDAAGWKSGWMCWKGQCHLQTQCLGNARGPQKRSLNPSSWGHSAKSHASGASSSDAATYMSCVTWASSLTLGVIFLLHIMGAAVSSPCRIVVKFEILQRSNSTY